MADALDSGSSEVTLVWVQVPSPALDGAKLKALRRFTYSSHSI